MKKLFTTLAFFIFVHETFGQDTLYYNELWRTTTKDNASYFRKQIKDSTGYYIEDYYMDGKIQMKGHLSSQYSLKKDGMFIYYNKNGTISTQGMFKNGKTIGEWKTFDINGSLNVLERYNDSGNYDGEVIYYYPDNKIKRIDNFSNGSFIAGKCFTETGSDTIYFPFRQMPEFDGGIEAMHDFIKKNIVYPKEASRNGIEGKVYVTFFVTETGSIENIYISESVNKLLDEQAIEVVKKMPAWKPGKVDGIIKRAQFNLPISFKL